MRLCGLVAVMLLGCPAAQPRPTASEGALAVTEPRKFDLVEGKPVEIDGVRLTLKSVMYTHATDQSGRGVNDSMMQLEITHQGKTEEVTLTRLSTDELRFTPVAGLELAIDYVDAYHQPSKGAVLVK